MTAGALNPVTFLVFDASTGSGVIRATVTVANELVRTRPVRVVSLLRTSPLKRFDLDPRIELTVLDDRVRPRRGARRGRAADLLDEPSRLRPTPPDARLNRHTDELLRQAIGELQEAVIVSTRPSLHLAAVEFAGPGVRTVGWDHLNVLTRFDNPGSRAVLAAAVPRLDAYVVLTDADARDYHRLLPSSAVDIRVIRNALPWAISPAPADVRRQVVIAVGRLVQHKGFARLIHAFAMVADRHPGWELHIHGEGPRRPVLERLVGRLGLTDRVRLVGYTADVRPALASASIFAMTSHHEGFPLVLIEALSSGLPLVAFDCPRGPAEIIRHRHNGLLVPEGRNRRFARALNRLMARDGWRAELAAQAALDARQYAAPQIAAQWHHVLDGVPEPDSPCPPVDDPT